MTREQLESYRSMQEEIRELQYKLEHLGEGDSMIGNDVIKDYRSGYPVPQAVVGVDWEKMERLSKRYEDRIIKLQKECEAVEEYIESIEDSLTRRLLRLYFLEGMTQHRVAKMLSMERSTVSKRINKAFSYEE